MNVIIRKAETRTNAAWYNFNRSTVAMHCKPECKGAGWDILTEDGDKVSWFRTKKAAAAFAEELGAGVRYQ